MALGENLIKAGVITADQLNKALDTQKSAGGKKLGEILIELGFANADQVNKAL